MAPGVLWASENAGDPRATVSQTVPHSICQTGMLMVKFKCQVPYRVRSIYLPWTLLVPPTRKTTADTLAFAIQLLRAFNLSCSGIPGVLARTNQMCLHMWIVSQYRNLAKLALVRICESALAEQADCEEGEKLKAS